MKLKWKFFYLLVIIYLSFIIFFEYIGFPVRKDERFFWPPSLFFSHAPIPTLDQLRSYNVVGSENFPTPLAFVLFGFLEYFFHGGIIVGRFVNTLISFYILYQIGAGFGTCSNRSILAAFGLACFPYYWGTTFHLYTDILAAFFVLMGVVYYKKGKHVVSGFFFICAIATRQFMLVFPLTIFIYEFLWVIHSGFSLKMQWIAPLVSLFSIVGWLFFFGGIGPQPVMESQSMSANNLTWLLPQNSLYFLACVGLYFVLPEYVLFRKNPIDRKLITKKNGIITLVLLLLFIFFPPLGNIHYSVNTMGYFDRTVRFFVNDFIRLAIFYSFALLACIRFFRINLSSLFLLVSGILVALYPLVWDKYALPLLVVFWYLKSIDELD